MSVRRVVANIAVADTAATAAFYRDIIGLEPTMDQGWIVTLAGAAGARAQLSIMTEGGSGTPVPDLSIEVDDLDAVLARAAAVGLMPTYGPAQEPWGVRRFYLRDPAGKLVNVLSHSA